jgi:oligopeptidase B
MLGRPWYEGGKLLTKQNTFNDFVDASRYLIDQKWADPTRLYAMGGSAGGLLMGAVINQAPELYRGVVAQVPFVDVVTTMLDESIPLTTIEYDEWGDPRQKNYYDYMLNYSPYDNVKAASYPNILVTTGLYDSQVQYWEPAKWVAKLRDFNQSESIILLKTNLAAGHGGASGALESMRETADEWSFLLMLDR